MNEQRDSLTYDCDQRPGKLRRARAQAAPGLSSRASRSRAFQHGPPAMTNGASADSPERRAKINLTSSRACERMPAQSANNTRLEDAAMKQN